MVTAELYVLESTSAVADPGFPAGGRGPHGEGAWTPVAVVFQKFCMSK